MEWLWVVPVLLVFYLILQYNALIRARNKVRESFAAIDVYLQNRFDALIKLAEAVVAYARHERETLERVTEMRQGTAGQTDENAKIEAYNRMDSLVRGITIQAENYPDLQAAGNYLHLQRTINDLEEKLAASRRTFNANVNSYNTKIETFPTNLFAGALGFRKKELLVTEEAKRRDVDMRSLLRG